MRIAVAILLCSMLAFAGSTEASARDDDRRSRTEQRKKRKNYAVSEWVYKRLNASHELLDEDRARPLGAVLLDDAGARDGLRVQLARRTRHGS